MTVGVVLSGGGARGIAHLGILKALEEFNVRIDCISGASVGAILGALYAAGHSPDKIMEIILSTRILRSMRPAWTLNGLLTMDSLKEVLIKYFPQNTFESLHLPLTVVATDIRKGQSVYFSQGELISALLASSCVPAVFNPVHFHEGVYIDGGIMDNLPARVIRKQCDVVIGLHCNYINDAFDFKNFRGIIERTLLMAINGNTTVSKGFCDVLIEPPEAGRMSTFDVAKAKDLFDIGYNFTKGHFKESDFYKDRA